MNTKTTIGLCVVLFVSMCGFYWLQINREEGPVTNKTTTVAQEIEQDLFDEKPDIAKLIRITCERVGPEPWVFEKPADGSKGKGKSRDSDKSWRMTQPLQTEVPEFEVASIVNRLKKLRYQVKYAPDQADGVTPAMAGLDPPRAELTLESEDGASLRIQIGKSVSGSETYLRFGDGGDIYVVRSNLSTLLKNSPADYRDRGMLKFQTENVTSVEITHYPEGESSVEYRLVRDDAGNWRFEEPFEADAVNQVIDGVIRPLSMLRATEWVDANGADNPGRYGFIPPLLEIEIVMEVEVDKPSADSAPEGASDKDDASEQDHVTEIQRETHEVIISRRGPIGATTSVYAALSDDSSVATIVKGTADRLVPDLSTWRNMKLYAFAVSEAERIEVRADGSDFATLVRNDRNRWVFEADDTPADGEAIQKLLTSIESVEAVSFVDGSTLDSEESGLDSPSSEVVVTVPGREKAVRIAIGNPTDKVSRRLYYVRVDNSPTIAKVRADDLAPMMRTPASYLDRSIFDLAHRDLKRIVITRPNEVTRNAERIVLQRDGENDWALVSPAPTEIDKPAVVRFTSAVAKLQSKTVISRDGSGGAFGLNDPTISIDITYFGKTPDSGTTPDASAPPLETVKLLIADNDKATYAKRSDSPIVYELRPADRKIFSLDLTSKQVFRIEESTVTRFSVTEGGITQEFIKTGDDWKYAAEPDLPIDPMKIRNLLLQIQDIKSKQMVEINAADLNAYGLDAPGTTLRIVTEEGTSELLVSASPCDKARDGSHYAMLEGSRNVFLITPDAMSRFAIRLSDYEKK